MKTKFTLAFALFCMAATAFGQNNFRITFDANFAGAACQPLGAAKIYAHSGIDTITGGSWSIVVGNWGADDGIGEMTSTGTDTWQIDFNIFDYYGVPEGTDIYSIGIVFRNEDGTLEGKDDNCADIFIYGVETGNNADISVENSDNSPFAGVTAAWTTTGIGNTPNGVSNIKISPNPVQDAAVFSFTNANSGSFDLTITNAMGQIMSTQRVIGNQAIIERNDMPAGMYFAVLTDDKGGIVSRRFVLN